MKDPTENHPREPIQRSSRFLRYSGLATQMLGSILVFTYAGYRLDLWQENQTPIWTLVLSLASIGGSLYLLIKNVTKI